jgi:hypothetical protein
MMIPLPWSIASCTHSINCVSLLVWRNSIACVPASARHIVSTSASVVVPVDMRLAGPKAIERSSGAR